MIVVGTAGHIDHGKSAIVKRLSGHDPDRLPEEKARGMTIDLGFAFMPTDDGDTLAFIDVPGHERFVKNMISGAGGIDLVMLVVAADDGWMPQSEEHFQITRLLGVNKGLIVINKTDLVDTDWLLLLEEEIRLKTANSFLQDCPIFNVSAQTGDGFEKLGKYLRSLTVQDRSHKDIGKPRLYVDRAFMRTGIGRVVAGTLRGGVLTVGQQVTIWPGEERAKIRSLQTNGQEVERATPGQRTAVTISGIDKENLFRGAVLSDLDHIDYFRANHVLALSIELLPNSPVPLKDRRRALIILGTTEVEGEIRIFQDKEIRAGSSGIVFFRPDLPLLGFVGDHYILRLPTPMVTLGGGIVLDHLKGFPLKKESERYNYLKSRVSGKLHEILESELVSKVIVPTEDLLEYANFSKNEISTTVSKSVSEGLFGLLNERVYDVHRLAQIVDDLVARISEELIAKPHLKGLSLADISRLSNRPQADVATFLDQLIEAGRMVKLVDKYNLVGRGASLTGEVKAAHSNIMEALKEQSHTPPRLPDLAKQGKAYREAIRFIIESGQGYKCGAEFLFLAEAWNDIISFIRESLTRRGELNVAELRDQFGFSRKFAIPILEETDRIKLTARDGDRRVKGSAFESA